MDSYDLFHQLTRGARFRRAGSKTGPKVPQSVENPILQNIKTEPCDNELMNETIKSEVDLGQHDEESSKPFQYLDSSGFKNISKEVKPKKLNKEEKLKQLQREKLSELRTAHRISVLGKNIPPPIMSFEELTENYGVSERLIKNLAICNYSYPTAIQMQAIPILLKKRPLMACAPTGSGKTIAFLTPILNELLRSSRKDGFRAIVLAPTRELAQQIYRECLRLCDKTGLKIHIINKTNQTNVEKFTSKSKAKFDVLISTPNRVRYLLQKEPPLLDLKSIEWIVIDEADRLMEEGPNNFKDQLDDIFLACTNPSKNLALFSATYTVPVAKWALKNLKKLVRLTIGQQNAATEYVEQELLFVGSESGKLLAVRDLVRTGFKPPILIFVQSKDRAKQLFEELLYDGINVDVIHADRTQQQRDNCVRAFREGNIWVLICTELMGRGIDFKGVNLVINYDFPPSTISYIHRIGRTGRAGRAGKAVTFFTQNDTTNLRGIAQIIKNSGGKVPDFMLNLRKTRKAEVKKLANIAPKRDDISTKPKPEAERQSRLKKVVGKFVKRRLSADISNEEKFKNSKKSKKMATPNNNEESEKKAKSKKPFKVVSKLQKQKNEKRTT